MRILGVDPGIATVGFAVLDADKRSQRLLTCGVITTPAKTQLSSRLDQIYRDLNELIAQFHPEAMAVEELFFNTNITTGIAVAHGRGIILLSGYQAGLQIYEYTPLQVKQAVVGYGRADKKQVMDMVRRILSQSLAPKYRATTTPAPSETPLTKPVSRKIKLPDEPTAASAPVPMV